MVVSSELMILDIILDLFFYEPPLFSEDYCFNPKKARGGGLVCPLPTLKLLYLEKSPHFPKNVLPDFLGAA